MTADDATLDPAQVRAARGLLGWSQADLARKAGVSRTTVIHYEQGSRMPIRAVAHGVRAALERGGAGFIGDGAASPPDGGVGVRLLARHGVEDEGTTENGPASRARPHTP